MKKLLPLLTLLFLFTLLSSHEFWLQPATYIYKKGDKANIRFRVGENFEGENWAGNRSKINFLSLYLNGKKIDLSTAMSDNKGDSLQYTLPQDGTAVIVYNGFNSFIELEPAKFNAYLEEDGLREAMNYRIEHKETDSMSHEFYQRSVKTILQIGEKYDSSFKEVTPLPLDIIPMQHPYLVKDKQKMTMKVLFNKKPLAEQLIKIWYRSDNTTKMEELLTDENGLVSFKIKKSGCWMVSTVKMKHLENDPNANWQSYWGSCTWGYQ
ncbi:MAG: DUF4198 domain-containing protein [Bacteroidota bacterium]|nr:DUF4198 domain-containing protein [Bacteroidota bacterium]